MWHPVVCFEKLRDTEAVRILRRKPQGDARAERLKLQSLPDSSRE